MVGKSKLIVKWDKPAYASLKRIFDHIKKDSLLNAIKVRDDILKTSQSLQDFPEKFPPDKFKNNNVGNYRAFEKYSYRVAYKIEKTEIKILRIRHVKQEPKEY